MQEMIAALNAKLFELQRMSFRIGINVGDIIAKNRDIFSDGVNIAARLQTLAAAGGICVSRGVRDHIRHLGSFRFEDPGEQRVKNIDRPARAFSVVVDDAIDSTAVTALPEPVDMTQGFATEEIMLDLAMWQTISASDQVPEFLLYQERVPGGEFAALARDRIAALSQPLTDPTAIMPHDRQSSSLFRIVKDSGNRALFEAYLQNIRRAISS